MVKRGLILIFGFVLAIFLITNINASIYFSNIQPTYSMGDIIDVQIGVNPIQEEYLLKTDLMCKEFSVLSFNSMPDESGNVVIKIPLSLNIMKVYGGDCYFKSVYADESQTSRRFQISRGLDIKLNVDSFFIKPGEEIMISGSVLRSRGDGANGIVEIKIPVLTINNDSTFSPGNGSEGADRTNWLKSNLVSKDEIFSGSVIDGEFSVNRTFAIDIPSGEYKIEVNAYEVSSSGKKTNEGAAYGKLKVAQVLTKIELTLNKQEINPGENVSFKSNLIDQAGYPIENELTILIRNNDTKLFEKIIKSDETIDYYIPTNMSSGYYEIQSSSSSLSSVKNFFVSQKARAYFRINNDSLIITNIGNIIYEKDIEIDLNNKSFIKHVSLDLGESKEFKLTGLDERYTIKVRDGDNEMIQEGVVLTGGVISVGDLRKGGVLIMSQPIVWIFLLVIFLAMALFLYRDYFRKRSITKPFDKVKNRFLGTNYSSSQGIVTIKGPETKEDSKKNLAVSVKMPEGAGSSKIPYWAKNEKKAENKSAIVNTSSIARQIDVVHDNPRENKSASVGSGSIQKFYNTMSAPTEAEQTLVSEGQKNPATVLLLKIKSPLTKIGKETIDRAIDVVYDKKGAVYETGEFVYVIFTPVLTKSYKNEITASKCAEKIIDVIKDYNERFKEKIDFGIGINTGEIISRFENRKLKFTAMGSLLSASKKLAEVSKNGILLSKTAYEKGMTEIKAHKKSINGVEAYEIRQIVDYEKNKKFIEDFMRRQSRV